MYLWIATPPAETSEIFATRLLEHGVIVAPGSFLGASGEGYVRFALVPTEEECARAVEILEHAV
jgi:aspartate/methionine/tyrosine aminotransferase